MKTTNCNGRSIHAMKEAEFQNALKAIWNIELDRWSAFTDAISKDPNMATYEESEIVQDEHLLDVYPGSKNRIISTGDYAEVAFVSTPDMDYIEYHVSGSNEVLAGIYKDSDDLYGISLVGGDCFIGFPGTLLTSTTLFEMLMRMSFVFVPIQQSTHLNVLYELYNFFEYDLHVILSDFEDSALDALDLLRLVI